MSAAAPEDDAATAAEHVLGLLPGGERAAFEVRLREEPALRALVAEWEERLAAVALEGPDVAPPPRVRRALERRLFPGRVRRRAWGAGLGGLLAAGAVAVAAFLAVERFQAPPLIPVEIAAEDRSLVLAVSIEPVSHTLTVDRVEGAAAPGRARELWLIAQDRAPLSLGLLSEEGRLVVRVSDAVAATVRGATLAVSDEPPGGSPTGSPTGDVLATGIVPAA